MLPAGHGEQRSENGRMEGTTFEQHKDVGQTGKARRNSKGPTIPAKATSDLEAALVEEEDEHLHYSQRAPWLRAGVLGANDGLVSVASLMIGVEGGSAQLHTVVLAGLSALVGGALSMGVGEYISVASQKDAEQADIEKERQQQAKGPAAQAHELEELAEIYVKRGLSKALAKQVAIELSEKDVIRAHARDELGIDMDELSNPAQAMFTSMIAFLIGAGIPLLAAAFIHSANMRLLSLVLTSTAALAAFGAVGAGLGGANLFKGSARVVIGGWMALAITYGIGRAFGHAVG